MPCSELLGKSIVTTFTTRLPVCWRPILLREADAAVLQPHYTSTNLKYWTCSLLRLPTRGPVRDLVTGTSIPSRTRLLTRCTLSRWCTNRVSREWCTRTLRCVRRCLCLCLGTRFSIRCRRARTWVRFRVCRGTCGSVDR